MKNLNKILIATSFIAGVFFFLEENAMALGNVIITSNDAPLGSKAYFQIFNADVTTVEGSDVCKGNMEVGNLQDKFYCKNLLELKPQTNLRIIVKASGEPCAAEFTYTQPQDIYVDVVGKKCAVGLSK